MLSFSIVPVPLEGRRFHLILLYWISFRVKCLLLTPLFSPSSLSTRFLHIRPHGRRQSVEGASILSFILIHLVSFIPPLSSIIGCLGLSFVALLVLWVFGSWILDCPFRFRSWARARAVVTYERLGLCMVDALIRSYAAIASTRSTITGLSWIGFTSHSPHWPSKPKSETQRTGREPESWGRFGNVFVLIAEAVTPRPGPIDVEPFPKPHGNWRKRKPKPRQSLEN